MKKLQLRPAPAAQAPPSARKEAACMRLSIRELNRSMESIEKMVEKSKRLISRSKEDGPSRALPPQRAHEQAVIASIQCSVRRAENFGSHKSGLRAERQQRSPSPHFQTQNLLTNSHHRNPHGNLHSASKESSRTKERSKQNQNMSSPYMRITNKRAAQSNSPQLSSFLHFSQSKSKQKQGRNPEQAMTGKQIRSPASSAKRPGAFLQKEVHHRMPSILIEDEGGSSIERRERSNNQYRFKTEHSTQHSDSQAFRLPEPAQQKKRIALKAAPQGSGKSQLTSQRSNQSALSAIKLTARQELVEGLARLETVSASEGERRAKFLLKIKKYGFVERHLGEAEIWEVYEQLVSSGLPEMKWPIAIVEAVYGRMGR